MSVKGSICRRGQATAGSTVPGMDKKGSWASKRAHRQAAFLHCFCFSPQLEFVPWIPSMIGCDLEMQDKTNPSLPKLQLVMVLFITAIGGKLENECKWNMFSTCRNRSEMRCGCCKYCQVTTSSPHAIMQSSHEKALHKENVLQAWRAPFGSALC